MTFTATAILFGFALTITLLTHAQSKGVGEFSLAPDAAYNAKWDACEAQARRRGTPPGTTGYVDFIENCIRVSTQRAAATEPRQRPSEKSRLGAAARSASKSHGRGTSLARVIGRGSQVE